MQARSGFWKAFAIGLVGLAAILAVLAASMYASLPKTSFTVSLPVTPSLTPTISQTPTTTPTVTLTARPTWTLRPSETRTGTHTATITNTPTPALIATLRAARPYKYNDRYQMAPYDAASADEYAQRMRQAPNDRYQGEQRDTPEYFAYYRYAVLAYREALLRFPADWRAENWQWGLAFSLGMTGDPQAIGIYTDLLRKALETPGRQITDLPDWVKEHDPGLTLFVSPLTTRPGALESALVWMQPGDVFFYYERTPNQRSLWPLTNSFTLSAGGKARWISSDLNSDGLEEIVLYHPDASGSVLSAPRVFSLPGGSPPREESVLQSAGYDFQAPLDFRLNIPERGDGFTISAQVYPACPAVITDTYLFTEGAYRFAERSYTFGEGSLALPNNLANCETLLVLAEGAWPIKGITSIFEKLAPNWPPALDLNGYPYPAGAGEALQKRLEIYQNADSAPFEAVYTACQQTEQCNTRAIMANARFPGDLDSTLRTLWDAGVQTGGSGIFDFNKDAQPERWFTVQHRANEALEFWILVQTGAGVRAVFVSTTDTPSPELYFSAANSPEPVFQLKQGEGHILRRDDFGMPAIESQVVLPVLTTYTRDQLMLAERELFEGIDPYKVRQRLLWTLDSGRFNCLNDRICDQFAYILALTYELTGQNTDAIDAYIKLWWENSASPLTAIARLKLLFNPPPTETPTMTPTPSNTPTVTLTPDPLRSSTPTNTPTQTGTATVTPTETIVP